MEVFGGRYALYARWAEEQKESRRKKYDLAVKEIARLEEIIATQRRWNHEKNIKTAESKQKAVDRIEKSLEKPQEAKEGIRFRFSGEKRRGKRGPVRPGAFESL
jgi:ATP-binding cassette subfamily F protein 3